MHRLGCDRGGMRKEEGTTQPADRQTQKVESGRLPQWTTCGGSKQAMLAYRFSTTIRTRCSVPQYEPPLKGYNARSAPGKRRTMPACLWVFMRGRGSIILGNCAQGTVGRLARLGRQRMLLVGKKPEYNTTRTGANPQAPVWDISWWCSHRVTVITPIILVHC